MARPPKILVASHERSGTHFLMNTVAECFGYSVEPWIDFDSARLRDPVFFDRHVHEFFAGLTGKPMVNVVKSHHAADFFFPYFSEMTGEFFILYIYRDPRAVLPSFKRLVDEVAWEEGPRVDTLSGFLRARPRGRLLRYQRRDHPTMLHRWKAHVEGWLAAARSHPRIVLVRYEDLDGDFTATVMAVAERLALPVRSTARPGRDGLGVGSPAPVPRREAWDGWSEADRRFFLDHAGEILGRLGYLAP